MAVAAPRRRGSVLYTLLLLLLAVGVAPLLGTSYYLVSRTKDALELDQRTLLLDKTRGLSKVVELHARDLRSQVGLIARRLEADASPGDFKARVARLKETGGLKEYLEGAGSTLLYVSVVDASGVGPSASRETDRGWDPLLPLLQSGWVDGLQGKATFRPHVDSSRQRDPVLVLAEPVRPGNGAPQGVVLAVASLSVLQAMTRDAALLGGMEVYVVDGKGQLLAHSKPERLKAVVNLSEVEIVREFKRNIGRIAGIIPFNVVNEGQPERMQGTYTPVPLRLETDKLEDTTWGVIGQVTESTAFAAAKEMRNQSYALVAGMVILAAILGTVFAGEITRPIAELARGARRLAGGEYSSRVAVKSSNEVGDLADAFNQMGDDIQRAIGEVQRRADENKELFMGSIRMLANAIDEKDPYTRGHSERVAFYSAVIAKHMGMSEGEVEKVHLSGIIHDVGKIGIEDKILRKAAQLTEEEYEIMKQHPRKGEHILDAVPTLKQMAGAGLMHHENVDGSGYPDGLRGDQIPLLGRIVSVADAFDAMTTDRPYSKSMTFQAALDRLRFLVGKKFDEGCVAAMEKASVAGDLTPAKGRRAAVTARQAPSPPSVAPVGTR